MDARRSTPRKQRRVRHRDDVVSVLARNAREVEAAAQRGRVTPAVRTKFQAIALLLRDERARIRAADVSDSQDRKSTRLNSSHPSISYAVFCLKKKKHTRTPTCTP